MNAINENMNAETAKKHNPRIPYIAAANMGKSMMDLMLQELKAAPDVWQKMNAQQQSEVIDRVRKGIEYATAGAVNTIVTGGHTALAGTIDTVNIKDKIKLTVIVSKGNLSESLAELYAAGSESSCQILLADAAQYCGGEVMPKGVAPYEYYVLSALLQGKYEIAQQIMDVLASSWDDQ